MSDNNPNPLNPTSGGGGGTNGDYPNPLAPSLSRHVNNLNPLSPTSGGGSGTNGDIRNPLALGPSGHVNPLNPGIATNAGTGATTGSQAALVDQLDLMTARIDQMATMFDNMMTFMTANIPGFMPNAPGWPHGGQLGQQQPPLPQPQQLPPAPGVAAAGALLNLQAPGAQGRQRLPSQPLAPVASAAQQGTGGLPPAPPPVSAHVNAPSNPRLARSGWSGRSGTDSETASSVRSSRATIRQQAENRIGHRPPSTEDESDAYAYNRERQEIRSCKKIDICHFSPDDRELDFNIWICQFEDAVNRCLNPHSRRRHHKSCLVWLPSVLKADAYSIWSRSEYRRSDWSSLKAELESAFEDGSLRAEWKTNLKAYCWDEHGQTLQSYCANVKRLVDAYEPEMATCPAAKKAAYFLRFVSGLPSDYIQHVKLALPANSNNMDKARDICIQFQSCKRLQSEEKAEVGASVSLQAPTFESKMRRNEMEIARLQKELRHLKEHAGTKSGSPLADDGGEEWSNQ